jgi:HAD superfamily hydrolase (TIGR01549 family)
MIRGVIFDLGSTLISFQGEVHEVRTTATQSMVEQLNTENITLDNGTFINHFNKLLGISFEARETSHIEVPSLSVLRLALAGFGYGAVTDVTLERAMQRFYNHFEECWRAMPDLHTVLDELRSADYRLGIISNAGNVDNVQRLIDKADIRDYFDPILISSGVGLRKPHRLLFEAVLNTWQMPAEQAVMVGDMLNADILGAQGVGMHQIWITAEADNESNRENAASIVPEASVEKLRDVPMQIQSMAASS